MSTKSSRPKAARKNSLEQSSSIVGVGLPFAFRSAREFRELTGGSLFAATQADDDDTAWFVARPERRFRLRPTYPGEYPPAPTMLVRALWPGGALRLRLPLPLPILTLAQADAMLVTACIVADDIDQALASDLGALLWEQHEHRLPAYIVTLVRAVERAFARTVAEARQA